MEIDSRQQAVRCACGAWPASRVVVGTKPSTSYTDMLAWLGSNQSLPTAFFVENDIMAFGCMRALSERGLKVPDDLSIMGFDDTRYAAIANPPLSTVLQPAREIGVSAALRLLRAIDSPEDNAVRDEILPHRLVIRSSTRPIG